ncbi:MAG: universal stress protein [Actinomycetota bacterium]|nr:universal stress protein [Actinomycetota bacterium]
MSRSATKILLATDGSEDAALALRAAVDLSARAGSELHVVHVWRAFLPYSHPAVALATDSREREEQAQGVLFEQLDKVEDAGGAAVGAHLRRGHPVEVISDLVEELGIGLVVIGSRGLGPIERLALGSVSEGVIALASCPVLVARGGEGAWPISRAIVGHDSSAGAKKAGELATSIAKLFAASVLLVRALPVFVDVSEATRLAGDTTVSLRAASVRHELSLLAYARALEGTLGHRPRIGVSEGEAASVILEAAEGDAGPALVAVGRRGLGTLDRLRLGSVSTKVLRAARGTVLVCPS